MTWQEALASDEKGIIGGAGLPVPEFSETATLSWSDSGGPQTLDFPCIFDETYAAYDPENGVTVMSSVPAVKVRLAEIEATVGFRLASRVKDPNTRITARGVSYELQEVQPDGFGTAIVTMMEP